jgi:hypothetical protein
MRRTLSERFMEKVEPEPNSGCWLWIGGRHAGGYGMIAVQTGLIVPPEYGWEMVTAHRVAYELFVGPAGPLFVCHRCDTPPCVNPGHLFLGTNEVNVRDMFDKGRQRVGARHSQARLRDEQVREIRRLCGNGLSQPIIARQFGVAQQTISDIVTRRNWAHLV